MTTLTHSSHERRPMAAFTPDPELQQLLACGENATARWWLAENPSLTQHVQQLLARDEDAGVRCGLAENPALVDHVQQLLARDEDVDVRRWLANNHALALTPALPVALLREGDRTRAYLDDELTDVEPSVRSALAPSWSGSLEELLTACAAFAPAPV